jgi:pimeloyl-ACP methyl ester carboxylesterase
MEGGKSPVSKLASPALVILVLLSSCGLPPSGPLDESVDIGTHELHIYCIGEGSPTIVIDVGAGESYTSWQFLQDQLAQDTRVCTYDRAGYGLSEPGPMPRDSQRAADELHLLLMNAGEEGPYLLVGHSLGGLNMQAFAASYPEQVVGAVLLDPPPLGWLMGKGFPDLRELFNQETIAMRAAATGFLASSDPEKRAQGAFLEAVASEHQELFDQTLQQVGAIGSFGQMPLVVIGATEPDPRFGEDAEAFRQYWNDESRELAAKSESGRFILAEGSSHHIHLDTSRLVIDGIREILLGSHP